MVAVINPSVAVMSKLPLDAAVLVNLMSISVPGHPHQVV